MLARGQVPLVKDHSLQVARSTQSQGLLLASQATTPETTTPKRLLGLLTTALRSAAVRTARAVSHVGLTEDSSFFSLQRCLHARSINVRNKNNSVNVPHSSVKKKSNMYRS